MSVHESSRACVCVYLSGIHGVYDKFMRMQNRFFGLIVSENSSLHFSFAEDLMSTQQHKSIHLQNPVLSDVYRVLSCNFTFQSFLTQVGLLLSCVQKERKVNFRGCTIACKVNKRTHVGSNRFKNSCIFAQSGANCKCRVNVHCKNGPVVKFVQMTSVGISLQICYTIPLSSNCKTFFFFQRHKICFLELWS